jgi:hypothetical protein
VAAAARKADNDEAARTRAAERAAFVRLPLEERRAARAEAAEAREAAQVVRASTSPVSTDCR